MRRPLHDCVVMDKMVENGVGDDTANYQFSLMKKAKMRPAKKNKGKKLFV